MLHHVVTAGLVVFLGLSAAGCSDPYESAAEKLIKQTKEFVTVMKGVKTEADADAAVPKLEAIAKEFDEIAADLKKQPKMTDAQKKKVEKVFNDAKADMEALSKERGNMMSGDLKAMMKLQPSLAKVTTSMREVQKQWAEKGAPMR
jgi:hypothetical protein